MSDDRILKEEEDMVTAQKKIIGVAEDTLEKMQDVLEQMEEQELLVAEQERMIADRDEYINVLSSSQHYLDLLVVIVFSYLYGAWFGVYMCAK